MAANKIRPLTTRTITGSVYLTGLYSANPKSKAEELTVLMQCLLEAGIYESIEDAIEARVPVGTFVIIDDPNTPDLDFTVEIVPLMVNRD